MTPRARRLTAVLLVALGAPARAQTFGPWHVLGPFDHAGGIGEIAAPQPVERELKKTSAGGPGPDLEAEYAGRGGVVRWRRASNADAAALDAGTLDLARELAPTPTAERWSDDAVAYLYRRIDCEEPLELALGAGSDDGLRLWANGTLLVDRPGARALSVQDHRIVLRLARGANHLVAKVTNLGGPWAFRVSPWSEAPQAAIDAAIDRGVRWLAGAQLVDGSWGHEETWGNGHAAFALYALLECGVPPDDPVARMARAAVEARPAATTYAHASVVLARCALGVPRNDPQLAASLARLVEQQESNGRFGYPVKPDGVRLVADLSNTLYAALAYRAAARHGLEVPAKAWVELAEGVLDCAAEPVEPPRSGAKARRAAGFAYTPGEAPTGSMTAAGISALTLAEEAVGAKLPPALRARIGPARDAALAWIEQRLAWDQNPGPGGHHYFWIYGVERVGTLLGKEEIGGVAWYPAGATYLVERQKEDGSWAASNGAPVDTPLALLFLQRATKPVTRGAGPRAKREPVTRSASGEGGERESDPRSGELAIRAGGEQPTVVTVLPPGEALLRELERRRARIASVELLASVAGEDLAPLARIDRELAPSELGGLRLEHVFPRPGLWTLVVRASTAGAPERVLSSGPVSLRIRGVFDERRLAYASDPARNLARGPQAKVEASSSAPSAEPGSALDGSYATAWRCAPGDRAPSLRVRFERPVAAERLALTHAAPRASAEAEPRVLAVEVVLDGSRRHELDLDRDPLAKTSLELGGGTVRELEVRVRAATEGELGAHAVGFAEVELFGKR